MGLIEDTYLIFSSVYADGSTSYGRLIKHRKRTYVFEAPGWIA